MARHGDHQTCPKSQNKSSKDIAYAQKFDFLMSLLSGGDDFKKGEDAHTSPFPGMYSWNFSRFCTEFQNAFPKQVPENFEEIFFKEIGNLFLDESAKDLSREERLSLFKDHIAELKRKLYSRPLLFAAAAIFSANFESLTYASETEHIPSFCNQKLDAVSEAYMDGGNKPSYKVILAQGLLNLLEQEKPISLQLAYAAQEEYLSKVAEIIDEKLNSGIEVKNSLKGLFSQHALYNIKLAVENIKLKAKYYDELIPEWIVEAEKSRNTLARRRQALSFADLSRFLATFTARANEGLVRATILSHGQA